MKLKDWLMHPVVDFAIRIAAMLSLLVSGFTAAKAYQLSQCQSRYNEINNQRTRVLTDSAAKERAAEAKADRVQAALWLSPLILKPADQRTEADKLEILRLFTEYQKGLADQERERAEADKTRAEHPVPPPPSETCG